MKDESTSGVGGDIMNKMLWLQVSKLLHFWRQVHQHLPVLTLSPESPPEPARPSLSVCVCVVQRVISGRQQNSDPVLSNAANFYKINFRCVLDCLKNHERYSLFSLYINFNVQDCLQNLKNCCSQNRLYFTFLYLIIPIILAFLSFLNVYHLC